MPEPPIEVKVCASWEWWWLASQRRDQALLHSMSRSIYYHFCLRIGYGQDGYSLGSKAPFYISTSKQDMGLLSPHAADLRQGKD